MTQVAIVFAAFVVLRAMDRVFNKRVNDRMVNYQLMYVLPQLQNCIAAATPLLHTRTACPPTATTTTFTAPAHPARPLAKGTSTSCGRSASR